MPLVRIIQINSGTKVGIWHISEPEDFFREKVNVAREVHHPHKRLQHLAARYLLTILEHDFPVCEIQLSKSKKPFLPKNSYFFSLAHSGNYAVAIVSKKYRVGIDVEMIGEKVQKIAPKFLNPEEQAFLDKEKQIEQLIVCWSAKEAVYKWDGDGGVSFRENIHIQPFSYDLSGSFHTLFTKNGHSENLHVHYQIEKDHCVAWAIEEKQV